MSNIAAYLSKAMLDWTLGGAAATQPGARWAGLAVGNPTTNNNGASEMGTLSGYSRVTALFGAAASPAGSASNTAAMSFGPFSSNGSALGCHLWDGSPVASSSMLLEGTLLTARTFIPGDILVFAAGALNITLT